MNLEGADNFDCTPAWESGVPYMHVKSALYKHAMLSGGFHMEYPYDEYFGMATTKILTIDAYNRDIPISVHYRWEPLDENIIIYSIKGKVMYTDVSINDDELGFVIDSSDADTIMAFSYSKIFWIEEADE